MIRFAIVLLVGLTVSSLTGCGGGFDRFKKARPKTVAASGTVIYRNQPLADAIIVCFPTASGDKAVAASAYSGTDGSFSLQAYPPDKGAVPGNYQVTIQKSEEAPAAPTGPNAHDAPPPPKPRSLIPAKYGQIETSGLTLTIPDGGISDIKLELKD